MASPLSLLIGLRFSRGRRRSGMVSLISVISTIGIALGVAVLIVGLSAMNGFERELNNRILAVVPHGDFPRRRLLPGLFADRKMSNRAVFLSR